ncbi:hypothetical protein BDR05DRAFT_964184 [Suillus weaverae]|nr:hypothetical protein BDR05DRAFT_964184 [Suillus weaverae]
MSSISQSSAKIYVGNLSWNTTDDTLRNAFSSYGPVLDSIVMRDRDTGRSRGFGFVTYGTTEEADHAIANMNEQELDGRRIKVNLANPRSSGTGGSGGAGFGGGYGGGGGYSGSWQVCKHSNGPEHVFRWRWLRSATWLWRSGRICWRSRWLRSRRLWRLPR